MSETAAFTHTVSTDGPAKGMTFSMRRRPGSTVTEGAPLVVAPLVVALPGGTYTSVYFDVPGQSLLDTAETLGIPVIAVDRPGYLGSAKVEVETGGSIILGNAEALDHLVTIQRGLRAVAEYEAENGPFTEEELAWADALFDEHGIGRNQ